MFFPQKVDLDPLLPYRNTLSDKFLIKKNFKGNLIRQGGTFLGTTSSGNPFRFLMKDGSYRDQSNKIIEGKPDTIKTVNDVWKFSKNMWSQDPTWYLVETSQE